MNPPSFETNLPMSPLGSSLLIRANKGRTLHAFGHAIVVLLDGKQTGEKFTAFLNISPPGCGPGPHYHEREDELSKSDMGWLGRLTDRRALESEEHVSGGLNLH